VTVSKNDIAELVIVDAVAYNLTVLATPSPKVAQSFDEIANCVYDEMLIKLFVVLKIVPPLY